MAVRSDGDPSSETYQGEQVHSRIVIRSDGRPIGWQSDVHKMQHINYINCGIKLTLF
ncbi:hypothetical protein HanRHA438_Chr01g0016661 [Helianthus annuus]|nr:hypothetical protein HanRHA438_Chr01g0016661 [Helianthus annuus]